MIDFTTGNILKSKAEALVNTVNCVGVMGRGIALQFKNVFPSNFKAYAAACERKEVQPGRMFVHETGKLMPRFIVNFPTKRHWKGKSRIEDIISGLEALAAEIRARNIRSIAVPPLGSGLGGLDWKDVRPLIVAALEGLQDVAVTVYEPAGAPAAEDMHASTNVPNMTAGRAALVGLMNRYLGGLLDPFVTLIEVHKLMYFMQEAGQPLKLRYAKAHYGPYAENLRHVLRDVEGHLVSGYADGGDDPTKELKLVPGAIEEAARFLQFEPEARSRFDRVAELVDGFETPFGLELLATVHWVANQEGARSADEAAELVYAWNSLKEKFTRRQITLAYGVLADSGWMRPA